MECVCQSPLLRLLLRDLCAPRSRWLLLFSKHVGVRSLFNRQYVKTGKIPRDLARIYNDLFERRQEGDYIDFVSFEASQVLPWISNAEELTAYVASLIEKESV